MNVIFYFLKCFITLIETKIDDRLILSVIVAYLFGPKNSKSGGVKV